MEDLTFAPLLPQLNLKEIKTITYHPELKILTLDTVFGLSYVLRCGKKKRDAIVDLWTKISS